jgi:integrase
MKLTAKRVLKLLKKPGRHGDGLGLYLQVHTPGRGAWILRYERDGRERAMGLGSVSDFTLAEARERARNARQLLTDGIDPLARKRAERERQKLQAARDVTFKQCAEQYYSAHADKWANLKHRQQFTSTMRDYVYPTIGGTIVSTIDEPIILKTLTPIWKDKTVTAKRVRNRIAAVLDYAAACKYRSGTNPARWEGNLEFLLPRPDKVTAVKNHPALPYREIGDFVSQLRQIEGVPARALEVLILTATRTSEVVGAVWDEIDLAGRVWTIPSQRMKVKKAPDHRVPLSDRVVEILQALPREADNPFVFVGVRPGSNIGVEGMYRVLKTLRDDVVVHGFRSTFSTWAYETSSYSAHLIEQSLAHTVGSEVERAYRRSDLFAKRRRLMNDWAKYCATPKAAAAPEGATVVPLRGAP